MKYFSPLAAFVIFASAACAPALAEENGTKAEAIAMVDTAVAHVQKVGQEKAFKDFTDKSNETWHKKDLYVFVVGNNGITTAHGGNEKLIGKDMSGIKDQNGKPFMQNMIAQAKKAPGWVDYDWIHPQTKKPEAKASYVRALPGFDGFVGVGVYR